MPAIAIVPAAGRGERFGGGKLLADVGGVPLLDRTLRCLLDAGIERVVVVLPPVGRFDAVRLLADPHVLVAFNPDPARGMFSSIQVGVGAGIGDPLLILPGDMPFVSSGTVVAVLAAHLRTGRLVVPRHDGRRGHPIALPGRLRSEILNAAATDNLSDLLKSAALDRLELDVEDAGVVRDVDVVGDSVVTALFARIAELRDAGRRFAIATVVRTDGSTPQVVGAKLVVVEDDPRGKAAGTLGGGCVEADAIDAAREVLAAGGHSLRAYELTEDLAWNTGLVCGGTMWILAERGEDALAAAGRPMIDELARAAGGESPIVIATLLRRRGRDVSFAGRVFVDAGGRVTGSLGDPALDGRAADASVTQLRHGSARVVPLEDGLDLLVDPVSSRPRLVVAGGGHVALAIARQALLLDFDVTILEDRPEFADPARFGGATVIHADVPATLATLDYGWSSFVVIATRGHKLDADCILAAVKTNARYIGLLGSRRKTVLIEAMLREAGVADDRIAVIHAPVGLDLGGRTPAEIALSVLAEITQLRYQATGRPLGPLG